MLTRRRFIGTTLGAGAALAAGAQRPAERATEAHDRRCANPHVEGEYAGLAVGRRRQAAAAGAVHRSSGRCAGMDEAGVDRAVIVPPALNDRNDYALEAAQALSRTASPSWAAFRCRIRNRPSCCRNGKQQPGMLGVRLTFNTPQTAAWLKDGTADWFWPAAEKAGCRSCSWRSAW